MDSTAHNDLLLQSADDLLEQAHYDYLSSLREDGYPLYLLEQQYIESLQYEELEVERIRKLENN